MTQPVPRRRRLLIILNPAAGLRRPQRLARVTRHLEAAGCEFTIERTQAPGHATRLAAAARAHDVDAVVAAGGDGTINEVVNGLADPRLPLGIVPLGTANVLAAEIGLPVEAEAVTQTLLEGTTSPIALGSINGRRFMAMVGAGFDAHVVNEVSLPLKRWLGKGAYVLATLDQMLRFRFPSYRVTIDGVTHEVASVVVANGRYYAGRHLCAPEGDLEAPDLQVCLFQRRGALGVATYGLALLGGRLPRLESVTIVPAKRLVIDGPAGDPVQVDGDVGATLPAEIEIQPGALCLIRPARNASSRPESVHPEAAPAADTECRVAAREMAPEAGD